MSNVISFQDFKNKKTKQEPAQQVNNYEPSKEFHERLMRISTMIRNINETMEALKNIQTQQGKTK